MRARTAKEGIEHARRLARRGRQFLVREVWDLDLASVSALKASGVRLLRVMMLVFKGFKDDECSMHASALTFSTLMAMVPILAICLSMARGLGDADSAKRWIQSRVQDWTETFKPEPVSGDDGLDRSAAAEDAVPDDLSASRNVLAQRINALVETGFEKVDNINFAKLGTAGLVLLIWMVIEMLGRVERSFNRVWGIKAGRTLWRRFTDYLSVLLILPVLIVAAASLPLMDMVARFMPDQTVALMQRLVTTGAYKNLVVLVMTVLAFTFVIMFMPNTAMRLKSGLTGGFFAALLFLMWLWICAMLQVGAARAGRIYGSFAVAPIVLAWVHVSWQIVLFGAEVAFSVENCDTFRMEQGASEANTRARLLLALSVVTAAARCMAAAAPPFEAGAFGHRHKVPVRFLNTVIADLVRAGYMAPITDRQHVYVLLRAPSALPVRDILNMVLSTGTGEEALGLNDVEPKIRAAVVQALSGMDDQSMTVQDLLTA